MKTYIYILKLSKRLYDDNVWTKADNEAVNNHFLRLKEDYEKGIVLHVGRTVNPTDDGFGVVIYQAEDDIKAMEYMLNDPAVKNKQMTATFMEYKVVFK